MREGHGVCLLELGAGVFGLYGFWHWVAVDRSFFFFFSFCVPFVVGILLASRFAFLLLVFVLMGRRRRRSNTYYTTTRGAGIRT
jgi:hypothetical protein